MSPKRSHFDPTASFTPLKVLSSIITFCCTIAIIELVVVTAMLYLDNWALLHNQIPSIHLNPFFKWYLANQDLFTLLFYGGLIVFLIWIYQAYRNLYALDQETETTPGDVAIGCILPIANLWRPYVHMRELWQKMIDANNWQLVKTWWAAFIFTGIIFYIPQLIFPNISNESLLLSTDFASIISTTTFFYTVAAICMLSFFVMTMKLVQTISNTQAEKLLTLPTTKADHSQALLPGQPDPTSTGKTGIGTKITLGIIGITVLSVVILMIVYVIALTF